MDEEAIADLKQFIATVVRTTVRDELVGIENRLGRLEKRFDRLEKKVDDKGDEILSAIAATMQNHINYTDKRFDNHEKRLRKLERKPRLAAM